MDIPLGGFTEVANDLVQIKVSGKEINPTLYQLLSFNKYLIEIRKPYPDEVYDITLTANENYHFYFAIEGIGRYSRPEGTIR